MSWKFQEVKLSDDHPIIILSWKFQEEQLSDDQPIIILSWKFQEVQLSDDHPIITLYRFILKNSRNTIIRWSTYNYA